MTPTQEDREEDREEWMRRYVAYLSGLGWSPYQLDAMAFNAWESWPDDDPEEIASSDLHCMRSDSE